MKEIQLSLMLNMENSESVFDEVRAIVLMMFPEFDFGTVERVSKDIVRLFSGQYPGYRKCTTQYHDLKHTTDAFLAMARLMHGAFVYGENLTREHVNLGLICALMHDTGYIQTLDDDAGTGAKYTRIHIRRSIAFTEKYIADNGLSKEDLAHYSDILTCTGLDTKINEIRFASREIELLGKMLGTADLLGQMADRAYLEKLLFLFYEFREGGVMGCDTELDLLKKTITFYALTRERFASELGSVNEYMCYHFKSHRNLNRDLYMETMEKNIGYLKFILEHHEEDYRDYLKRDDRGKADINDLRKFGSEPLCCHHGKRIKRDRPQNGNY